MITLKLPVDGGSVSLRTAEQAAFYRDEHIRAGLDGAMTFSWFDLSIKGTDRSFPAPVHFSWEGDVHQDNNRKSWFYLLVSETKDMQSPWVYSTDQHCYDVYNLKVGTKYFWCIQKNGLRSEVFSFRTLLTFPRCIKIEDVPNVRDMGGYPVAGGRIRQGLVYRGSEFENRIHLSGNGAEELQRLGIRTELDTRGEVIGLVDFTTAELYGIRRIHVPNIPYAHVFEEEHADKVIRFFEVFTHPENYPIYYHCRGGADRTGTFAFILGAFLGMRLEDLIDEYEFTSMAIWGIRSRNYTLFQEFLEKFMALPGDTLQEKGTYFLREYAKLTDAQLITINNIMIEQP